jgi:predicted small integral membrane protein
LLRDVWYRQKQPVPQHVAIIWPPEQEEPWHLMTDVTHLKAKALSQVFARWMTIEEYYRDAKNKRNGFALRLIQIQDSQRLSRFLRILAMAYLLLVTVGLYAADHWQAGPWCAANRAGQCSLFLPLAKRCNTGGCRPYDDSSPTSDAKSSLKTGDESTLDGIDLSERIVYAQVIAGSIPCTETNRYGQDRVGDPRGPSTCLSHARSSAPTAGI